MSPEEKDASTTSEEKTSESDLTSKATEKKENQVSEPEKFKVGEEEFTGAELAGKYGGSVSKMHEATQEAAELRRQNEALQGQVGAVKQATGEQGEPTEAQIEQQIADYEANYESEKATVLRSQLQTARITRDVTASVTEKLRTENFSVNRGAFLDAVKRDHPSDFESVRRDIEQVNPGFAMDLAKSFGISNPLEAAYEFFSVRGRRQAASIAAMEKAKRDASHVTASGVPPTGKEEETEVIELTAEEKAYAKRTHSEMTAEEAYETYKQGKVLLAKEKEKRKLSV